ncbi:MAG: hypothetical protein ACI4XF_10945, partial [Oscillospiraceae bacterium]
MEKIRRIMAMLSKRERTEQITEMPSVIPAEDIPEEVCPDMTMSEAQKAGFQFRYSRDKSLAIITSIHIRSDKIILPAHIDGKPVEQIADNCRCLIEPDVEETELFLPQTLKYIGERAFYVDLDGYALRILSKTKWQPILSDIHFPKRDSYLYIENHAFYGQSRLNRLIFHGKTHIG